MSWPDKYLSTTLPIFTVLAMLSSPAVPGEDSVPLPDGAQPAWGLSKAVRTATPTRERIGLEGLWRWQPSTLEGAATVPTGAWSYLNAPGSWTQSSPSAHASWKDTNIRNVNAAWYQREITIPSEWAGRKIAIGAEYVNSLARVYLDGKKAGDITFPSGAVDLTAFCRAGETHLLSIQVLALPLKDVMLTFRDSATAREVKAVVQNRGLCGAIYLEGTPLQARIVRVKVDTSVRKMELTVEAALENLDADKSYVLSTRISDQGRGVLDFNSAAFKVVDLQNGRFAFNTKWKPGKLWDLHTPENKYTLQVSLSETGGTVLDTALPERFGFREFWIDGRDFYLNGTRVFLSSMPLENTQSYESARACLARLKGYGINFVFTHVYSCAPGTHLSFSEVLRAADDVGIVVALSQPHCKQYEWDKPAADKDNGYARHAEFYANVAGNHPAVMMYATSHNLNGYAEDMNPDLIDGTSNPRSPPQNDSARLSLRAEAIIRALDPSRIVYHHHSGNLGAMYTCNFYTNFTPIQEMSDWFEHWATQGKAPAFLCEYGVPHPWDWTMYRGFFKDKKEFGSAVVPWDLCTAEWNSQFLGDRAFQISEREKKNVRWEADMFAKSKGWHRWDYPSQPTQSNEDFQTVLAMYETDNLRAFRAWGLSASSAWGYQYLKDGEHAEQYASLASVQALARNNLPLLAYIAGRPEHFTGKDHVFFPGESVRKQFIVLNNSRQAVTCECSWSLAAGQSLSGQKSATVETGQQARIPLDLPLPASLRPGEYKLSARAKFSTGEVQEDDFLIHVIERKPAPKVKAKLALFDPRGETASLLKSMGVMFESVGAGADLSSFELFVVGKAAITLDGAAPDINRVRDGLKVVIFEQTSDVLERRFGFRVQDYGLRQVFARVPNHPLLSGLENAHLRDWRGNATINPPRLKYEPWPRHGPSIKWCGMQATRIYRCGNYGNVASVLIEKPACGDFLPIVDGGFSLQYSPLMEYREGKGVVLFCQLDVTGRNESEPAAERLAANILEYVSAWAPAERREAAYAGDPAGKQHLIAMGVNAASYAGGDLKPGQVLIVGPGGGQALSQHKSQIDAFLKSGGHLLAVGLDEQETGAFLPIAVKTKPGEHISSSFDSQSEGSLLAGIGPSDVYNRAPRKLPLLIDGVTVLGNGVLGMAKDCGIVFFQLVPWQFEYRKNYGLKKPFRHATFTFNRLLANLGTSGSTTLLERFRDPVVASKGKKGPSSGLYLDEPEEWDDPYRCFRW